MSMKGLTALQQRFAAITDNRQLLGQIAGLAVREAAIKAPVKTGNLRRSIQIGTVTDTTAQVVAGAHYARYVEEGTGLYGPKHSRIVPVSRKALRWMGGPPGSMRLSGSPRKGKAGAGAGPIFARSVAGRRATPFFFSGVQNAIDKAGLAELITKRWNDAA